MMKRKWCELGELADASIGFKSLQNQFFYLDNATIEQYGIEEEFLRSIIRMKDFNVNKYLQNIVPNQFFFHCTESKSDIKGTGALRYIRAMENNPAKQKKQSGKQKTISQVLTAQSGEFWYAPKAKLHKAHIWLRKAFDSVYSPFLFNNEMVVDQRCNFIRPIEKIGWRAIASLLSSSIFAYSVEATGASSLGAGALEVPTTMLRGIRVPDIRQFSKADEEELEKLGQAVWKKSRPTNWGSVEMPDPNLTILDKWLLEKMGNPVSIEQVYNDLLETYQIRKKLAGDKAVTEKKSITQNVESVADTIVAAVRPILEGRRFPESFFSLDKQSIQFDFSGHSHLIIHHKPFLSNSAIKIVVPESGTEIFENEYTKPVAEVMIRALMMARRKFNCPADTEIANAVLSEFHEWINGILDKVTQYCCESTLGTKYESRLFESAMRSLGLHLKVGDYDVFGELALDHDFDD